MDEFESIDPVKFAAWVSQLPEDHPMQISCRVAAEVAELRRERRRGLREASHAVCQAMRGLEVGPSYEDMQRRRGLVWSERLGRWAATPLSEVE